MIIICYRDPDASNEYEVFAEGQPEPRIIDVDYGRMDLSNPDEFREWAEGHLDTAKQLNALGTPNGTRAALELQNAVSEAADNFGHGEAS